MARGADSVLITGAAGSLGSATVRALAAIRDRFHAIVALDVRHATPESRCAGVEYVTEDIRDPGVVDVLTRFRITTVVHLAAIVTPQAQSTRAFAYSVDVLGTKNVIECCVRAGVQHLIVASSGAVYGYYADNPQPLREDDRLRGNPEFAYADHKRRVEEMLAEYRRRRPELRQLVFRAGTILGATTANQITSLFERRVIMGLTAASTPFVFVWDQDVVACIIKGILERREGIYNVAGDGTLTLREIARRLGKRYVAIPASLLGMALWVLRRVKLTRYGPEQVGFLRFRPVLANDRLKREFGYTPEKTTAEAFEFYARSKGLL